MSISSWLHFVGIGDCAELGPCRCTARQREPHDTGQAPQQALQAELLDVTSGGALAVAAVVGRQFGGVQGLVQGRHPTPSPPPWLPLAITPRQGRGSRAGRATIVEHGKINVESTVVGMEGDEMARIIWQAFTSAVRML